MLTLDQVRALEERVEKTITVINNLRKENIGLRDDIVKKQNRIAELETLIDKIKLDQVKIEESIVKALGRLENFTDIITGKGHDSHSVETKNFSGNKDGLSKKEAEISTDLKKAETSAIKNGSEASGVVLISSQDSPEFSSDSGDLGIF